MKGVISKALGDYVKARRLSRKLDIKTVAEHSGFHESYWRKLEAGHYAAPDPKHLRVIAETISCPLADLYSLCDYTVPKELPSLGPYLRTTTNLSDADIVAMEQIFRSMATNDDDRRAS